MPVRWTKEDDSRLRNAFELYGTDWTRCSAYVGHGRTPRNCWYRWTEYLSPDIDTSPWRPKEIEILRQLKIPRGKGEDTALRKECEAKLPRRPFYRCRSRYKHVNDAQVAPAPRAGTSITRNSTPSSRHLEGCALTARRSARLRPTLTAMQISRSCSPASSDRSEPSNLRSAPSSLSSSRSGAVIGQERIYQVHAAMALYDSDRITKEDRVRAEWVMSEFLRQSSDDA